MDLKHQKYELNESMSEDELIRNLKAISETLQTTPQEEETQEYIPLAMQLAEDFFLTHPSRDVQLLVACCIADIMRIYAPEAPYKDQDLIKTIFMFLISQLDGISNPRHKSFSRYFYLMEILAYTKSFTLCFELEDNQEVFIALFRLIFRICGVHEPSAKVRSFMLDITTPLVCEADNISNELLDLLLRQIVEPTRSAHPHAYELCKALIAKTSDALALYVKGFLASELVQSSETRAYESTATTSRIYEVMLELYAIAPKSVKLALPTLEGKLQAKEEAARMKALETLTRLLSAEFAGEFPQLWQQFKQRFADIAPSIRRKCVAASKSFLAGEENRYREEMIELLTARKRDSDELVRFEVVATVVDAARRNWRLVVETSLFEVLKERVMDMKFVVRKEALQGFSVIYKAYVTEAVQGEMQKKEENEKVMAAMTTIRNKILHGYYMKTIEDKMLIERLLITCLVPYNLDSPSRMRVLYELLCDIDEHAMKAFVELHRQQAKLRSIVSEWIKIHRKADANKAELTSRIVAIALQLPESAKAKEQLVKFSAHMLRDAEVLQHVEAVLERETSCQKATQRMQMLLKKLGAPATTNAYYTSVKNLLNRIASVTVDGDAVEDLLEICEKKREGKELFPLTILAQVFAAHFHSESALSRMLEMLRKETDEVAYKENILRAFTQLTTHKSLAETFPALSSDLMDMCKTIAKHGTPKQCKYAVTFMCANTREGVEEEFGPLREIVDSFEASINISNKECRTSITALSVISEAFGERFRREIARVVGRNIVRGLLLNATFDQSATTTTTHAPSEAWLEKDQLPEGVRCVIAACKATVHWLLGLKNDLASAQKTMKIMDALIVTNGNIQERNAAAKCEMLWIKLTAAKAVLRLSEHKTLRESVSASQFLNLSRVMLDEWAPLREHFVKRLHKGLNKGSQESSLPFEFLALFVFGGIESDLHLLDVTRKHFNSIVNLKSKVMRATCKDEESALSMDLNYLPIYAIALLTHSSLLSESNDVVELRKVEKCLKFIIDPLIDSLESTNNINCIKELIRKVKLSKNKLDPENCALNEKMWTIAEIASEIMKYSSPVNKHSDEPCEANIELPEKFFEMQPSEFKNDKIYLTSEFSENRFNSGFSSHASRKRSFSNSDDDCIRNGDASKKPKTLAE